MRSARSLAFALMLAASLAAVVTSTIRRQSTVSEQSLPADAMAADMLARVAFSRVLGMAAPDVRQGPLDAESRAMALRALQTYHQVYREHPQSALVLRRIGLLTAALHGRDAAWTWFRQHADPDPGFRAIWRAAYGPGELPPSELASTLSALNARRLTWYGDLARWQLYRKAGRAVDAEAVLNRLSERLRAKVLLLAGAILFGMAAGLAGCVVWLLVLMRVGGRRSLRPVERPLPLASVPERVLWESFVLWFFVPTAGGWLLSRAMPGVRALQVQSSYTAYLLVILALEAMGTLAGGAWLAAVLRRRREEGEEAAAGLLRRESLAADVGWGVLAYLAALPIMVLTALLFSRLLPRVPTPPNPIVTIALNARGPWEWLLIVFLAAVAAPIVEELFFRGAVYGGLRRRLGAAASVVIAAAAFAAVHPQLPLGFLPIFALGAVFAYVVELRRSLVPSIVAHALNNAAAVAFLALMQTP